MLGIACSLYMQLENAISNLKSEVTMFINYFKIEIKSLAIHQFLVVSMKCIVVHETRIQLPIKYVSILREYTGT